MNIEVFLKQHDIGYEKVEHEPVYTWEQAERLVPELAGVHSKNLFLRNGKGDRHFLLVLAGNKRVDLKPLGAVLQVKKLGMASPERLRRFLGVEPGAVSLLGLVQDKTRGVEVVFDREVWAAAALQCHPLVNTATLALKRADVERFLALTGHSFAVVEVPEKTLDM